MPQGRFVEMSQVPVIYADDVYSAVSNGETVRLTFIERRITDGAQVLLVPVLELIRPASSIKAGNVLALMLKAASGERALRLVN